MLVFPSGAVSFDPEKDITFKLAVDSALAFSDQEWTNSHRPDKGSNIISPDLAEKAISWLAGFALANEPIYGAKGAFAKLCQKPSALQRTAIFAHHTERIAQRKSDFNPPDLRTP